ncbi:T9SS type A sorting domain-containing protein [Flexithrix dorotheae]|uniref:T9SS type A sorting domain-containing protein n=1 Tax=Flexithrix dorotheae TaxID=70993 RepID=UPI000371CB73|nr:T9SS type A sorting domain-containing protein [Flexithrix dorotheae]
MKLKYLQSQLKFPYWENSKKPKEKRWIGSAFMTLIMAFFFSPVFAQTTSIIGFTLVNAETNEDLMPLMDGDELVLSMLPTKYLNIRAEIDGEVPGSVVFQLNETDPFRIENVVPFALAGDNEGDYHPFTPPVGMHTVTATPFSESAGKGDTGKSMTISFKVVSGKMIGFTLINADTDEAIQPLKNGDKINLKGLPTENLNIKAEFEGKDIGSVVFGLNDQEKFRTENFYPYALVGDTDGDYNGFTPPFGMHTVTATPYTKANGQGMNGMSISVTFEVTDCDVDGAEVSTLAGETTVYTCPGDGVDDIIMVMNSSDSPSNYAYVVTDENLNVLGLPPGNEVNVEGAGEGICLIWGLSYTGNVTIKVGDNVGEVEGLTDECWDLSDNYVKLIRDMPDGGTVSTTAGDTVVYTCPGDGIDDVIMAMHETASNSNYAYVVTDENLNVLGLPPGNEVNVEGAGPGTCLIWGLSYTGNVTVKVGDNVGEVEDLTDECWDLSDNYVKLIRDMPDGGTVSTTAGDTVVYTCPGDGIDDVIMAMHETESNSNYAYVVTDENLNVLGLPPGNEVNVEGAGPGICLIWGLSYTGNITIKVGDNVGEVEGLTDECWDLSDNYVKLIRDMPDGGTVSTTAGDTVVYTCPGDGIDDVIMAMHETESNSNYAYVVTDENLNVLGLPPGNEVNVEGAGPGICLIWGLSYTGNVTVKVGDNVGAVEGLTDECWDLSDNYVKLIRDMPDGGTVSTTAGDTVVYTCPGDGIDDVIMAMHETESNSNYAYVVTDENLNVLGLPPGNEVNVEGAGEGICLIWGLSYTGNVTVKVGDNVGEVDSLTDECWDLSDNYVKLVRDKANCTSESLFTSILTGNNLRKSASVSVFPNPFIQEINISLDKDFSQPAGVKLFNATGKEVFFQNFGADYKERFIQLEVSDQLLQKGIYFLNVIGVAGDIETLRLMKE